MGAGLSSDRRSSGSGGSSSSSSNRAPPIAVASRAPQIRCYHCQGVFPLAVPGPQVHHVPCPYCGTINGVPPQSSSNAMGALAAAMSSVADLSPATAQERQEQLLRRLQAREITPLELLILREFVEHLQHNRTGATMRDIDRTTAAWVVEDVNKLPEELRSCCVCMEDVEVGQQVRTLPCLHTFHAECAEEWLKKKKLCPLCNFAIDGDQGASGESAAMAGEAHAGPP